MNQLLVFNFNGESIRTIEMDGRPYFVGIDVARILLYANPSKAVIDHCKGVSKLGIPSDGGIQETNIIPEGDMYRLIMKAADQSISSEVKEKAEKFEKWVFDEVLPSIRKTGSYVDKPKSQAELMLMYAKGFVEMENRVEQMETKVTVIQETFMQHDEDWRNMVNGLMKTASYRRGDYRELRTLSYKMLEERGRCDLNTRLRNLRTRLEDSGHTKTKVDQTSKMDVIENEPRLKEIYTTIVKELSIGALEVAR